MLRKIILTVAFAFVLASHATAHRTQALDSFRNELVTCSAYFTAMSSWHKHDAAAAAKAHRDSVTLIGGAFWVSDLMKQDRGSVDVRLATAIAVMAQASDPATLTSQHGRICRQVLEEGRMRLEFWLQRSR